MFAFFDKENYKSVSLKGFKNCYNGNGKGHIYERFKIRKCKKILRSEKQYYKSRKWYFWIGYNKLDRKDKDNV